MSIAPAPAHPVFTPYQPPLPQLPYSSWLRRVTSNVVDSPLTVASIIVSVISVRLLVLWLVLTVAKAIFYAVTRQTPGRILTKQRVFDLDTGLPTSLSRLSIRSLAHVVDFFSFIGFFLPLWDPMRQTIADKLMNTVVLRIDRLAFAVVVEGRFPDHNPQGPDPIYPRAS